MWGGGIGLDKFNPYCIIVAYYVYYIYIYILAYIIVDEFCFKRKGT